MFSAEAVLVVCVGVVQGFFGFPTFLFAPVMGAFVVELWSDYDVPITEFIATFFGVVLLGTVHVWISVSTLEHFTRDGPLLRAWALGIMAGVLMYLVIPAIEIRVRRR